MITFLYAPHSVQRAQNPGRRSAEGRADYGEGLGAHTSGFKAGISFVHLSDGSSFHPVQVVAPNTLPNYTDEVLKLTSG
jgi:hypothetical protein